MRSSAWGTGEAARLLAPDLAPQPAVFVVVGLAAYFTAIVRAPLTGIVLTVEMTGNSEQMLPLLVSCFCAYAGLICDSCKNVQQSTSNRTPQRKMKAILQHPADSGFGPVC